MYLCNLLLSTSEKMSQFGLTFFPIIGSGIAVVSIHDHFPTFRLKQSLSSAIYLEKLV